MLKVIARDFTTSNFYARPQSVDNVDKPLMQKWCIGAKTLVQQYVCWCMQVLVQEEG